jgi:hypothetical protein
MANITEEHLHHMARRHHATMKQLDGLKEKISGVTGRFVGTLEVGIASWLGGALEGKTSAGSFLKIPYNFGLGVLFLAFGHLDLAGPKSDHLINLGNGFLGSYVAASGYAFGKRWKETGKMFGGGGHPYLHPYENGWSPEAPPAVHGEPSHEEMARIVANMRAAAHAPTRHG